MSRLFEPMKLGQADLKHRIAMAPLTRYRFDDEWLATPMNKGMTAEATRLQLAL